MFYTAARLEFLIPHCHSLKEKRSVVNRLKTRLQNRFHVSIAEVDHQDLWQRSAVGLALVVSGPQAGNNAIEAIRREVEENHRVEILEIKTRIAHIDDDDP